MHENLWQWLPGEARRVRGGGERGEDSGGRLSVPGAKASHAGTVQRERVSPMGDLRVERGELINSGVAFIVTGIDSMRLSCSLAPQCSVSCGKGIQVRNVECVVGKSGALSAHCDPHTKPPAMQTCTTGISCNKYDVRSSSVVIGSLPQIPGLLPLTGFGMFNESLYGRLLALHPQLKQHAAGGDADEEDDDHMEDDEPYGGPRTLPLTYRQEEKPRPEGLVSESQQKIPNEAT